MINSQTEPNYSDPDEPTTKKVVIELEKEEAELQKNFLRHQYENMTHDRDYFPTCVDPVIQKVLSILEN